MADPFEIAETAEFLRVLNLPRRSWEARVKENDLYRRMTAAFRLPTGQQELRPIQAACLADGHDLKGLLAPVAVGEGKTLVSFLLPAITPGVKRPTLLLPAALVEKTWREFRLLQKHWICHPEFMTRARFDECVITYQSLGREGAKDALNARRPDIFVCDEVHKISNREAACTKRVARYMIANPETIFCGMSGTITKRSIRDYWHLLYWALKHRMPLPRYEAEMEKWAEALDERKVEAVSRRGAGALLHFVDKTELQTMTRTAPVGRTQQMPTFFFEDQLALVRKGYQRRLQETPGVVSSTGQSISCSLTIRRLQVDPGAIAAEHLKNLRETHCTPNGDLCPTPMDQWRVARELAMGFVYKWAPPPPKEWLSARKTWNWFVREILAPDGTLHELYQHLHLDSPMQVALAVTGSSRAETPEYLPDETQDEYADRTAELEERIVTRAPTITDPYIVGAYNAWAAIRGSYKINTVAEWLDETMLRYCFDWISANGPAIVWTEHRAFGARLAQVLGTGFCSNGGLDANGVMIEDYAGKTVVASVAANSEGRNLQAWSKSLITTMLPTGRIAEQLLGRLHRQGQLADNVEYSWIAACAEQDAGFAQMMADARYIQDTTGAPQKLLYADHV